MYKLNVLLISSPPCLCSAPLWKNKNSPFISVSFLLMSPDSGLLWPITERLEAALHYMASHDSIKLRHGPATVYMLLWAAVMLMDQDSLSMTYFCRWLLQAGQTPCKLAWTSAAVMDDTSARACFMSVSPGQWFSNGLDHDPLMVTGWAWIHY